MPADPALDLARDVAAALLGGAPAAIERVRGLGRNSGVFRVTREGVSYALKQYPPRGPGERDRVGIEMAALRFMTGHGVAAVPRPLAADPERGFALIEWIDGDAVVTPGPAELASAAEFLRAIHALRRVDDAPDQPEAAEACLSGAEIVRQIDGRLTRLGRLQEAPDLIAFLDRTVWPLFADTAQRATSGYAAAGLRFAQQIDPMVRTLCPSDFGFHNALRRPSGEVVFIDFDYFGWDDPVKLTCDVLLHPGMQLSEALKRQFAASAFDIYGADASFAVRLPYLYPLFALRWCLILLNEFLPERWVNRVNAGGAADWREAKHRQLDRARDWAHLAAQSLRGWPYAPPS